MIVPAEALRRGAEELGVPLDDAQVGVLDRYVERLLAWNAKVNLTAVTEPLAIVDKHLLDCLLLARCLPDTGSLIDVGAGPGLPSVVLAVARPGLKITAVESIQKKAMFIRTVARELDLDIEVAPVRLEAFPATRTFNLAVSRATFDPPEWVERGARLVDAGGRLAAMLSERQPAPSAPAGWTAEPVATKSIGGALRQIAVYRRPDAPFHVENAR